MNLRLLRHETRGSAPSQPKHAVVESLRSREGGDILHGGCVEVEDGWCVMWETGGATQRATFPFPSKYSIIIVTIWIFWCNKPLNRHDSYPQTQTRDGGLDWSLSTLFFPLVSLGDPPTWRRFEGMVYALNMRGSFERFRVWPYGEVTLFGGAQRAGGVLVGEVHAVQDCLQLGKWFLLVEPGTPLWDPHPRPRASYRALSRETR